MAELAEIPFQQLLSALLDAENPFHPRFLYRLSDLGEPELARLSAIWPEVPLWRRQALMEDVEVLSERDTLLSFISLGKLTIHDVDPKVRLYAVRTLEDYEEKELIPLFLDLLESDPDGEVRAATASAMGRYVYAGEVDEIPASTLKRIEDHLLNIIQSEDLPNVRRSALESLGFSSREEVPALIKAAFTSKEKEWVASALFAMGRSGDENWHPQVLAMLENALPLLRCEAARAAGELEMTAAVPVLLELIDDPDDNTRLASIWSLSQIGGEGVRDVLESLYEEAEDDDEIEFLESALDNLAFTEDVQLMPLLDYSEIDGENFDDLDSPDGGFKDVFREDEDMND